MPKVNPINTSSTPLNTKTENENSDRSLFNKFNKTQLKAFAVKSSVAYAINFFVCYAVDKNNYWPAHFIAIYSLYHALVEIFTEKILENQSCTVA